MGLRPAKNVPPVQVALVGLSGTGKSHFLSIMCGDGVPNDETTHPTLGFYRESMVHRGRSINFVEFGWTHVARGLRSDHLCIRVDVLMWFIDEHDSSDEIQVARSHVLGFVMAPDAQPMALCIVLNRGRPPAMHRVTQSEHRSRIAWTSLRGLVDEAGLRSLFPRGLYMTEFSYRDPQAALLCFDWLLDPDT